MTCSRDGSQRMEGERAWMADEACSCAALSWASRLALLESLSLSLSSAAAKAFCRQ